MGSDDLVILDNGVVLTVVNQDGRLLGTDQQVHQQEGWAFQWSADGLLVWLITRNNRNEARAAAERLAEQKQG